MKDSTEMYTCGLEMKGGLNGVKYPQDFVKAPKSQYPSTPAHEGKETPHNQVMTITLKC